MFSGLFCQTAEDWAPGPWAFGRPRLGRRSSPLIAWDFWRPRAIWTLQLGVVMCWNAHWSSVVHGNWMKLENVLVQCQLYSYGYVFIYRYLLNLFLFSMCVYDCLCDLCIYIYIILLCDAFLFWNSNVASWINLCQWLGLVGAMGRFPRKMRACIFLFAWFTHIYPY